MINPENISPRNNSKDNNRQENRHHHTEKHFSRRKFLKGATIIAGSVILGKEITNKKDDSLVKNLLDYLKKVYSRENNQPNIASDNISDKQEPEAEIKTENPKEQSDQSSLLSRETIEKPLTPMEKLTKDILDCYHQLYQKENYLPPKVFSKNFLIATQLQESKYDPRVESKAGAVGVMQVTPITIRDVIRCLHIFNKKGLVNFNGPKETELSKENVEEIKGLLKTNGNYGRAFGKLYFAILFKHYKVGEKEYKQDDIQTTQKKLLSVYNGGLAVRNKPENRWPTETKKYYRRIFTYMRYLEIFQRKLQEKNIQSNNDYLSMLLVKKMNTYQKIDSSDEIFDDLIDKYVEAIKLAETARQRKLTDFEIYKTLEKVKPMLLPFYLNKLNQRKKRH